MKIKTFEAKNFKGLENIAFELSEIEVIQGPNGVGKTSILDAISWVLYGTDSEGHDNFEIKPVSLEGTGVIVSVELKLEFNKNIISLRKELHEKISSEGTLKGNTYKYYIDGIPVSAADWGDWLKTIGLNSMKLEQTRWRSVNYTGKSAERLFQS